MTSGLFKVDKLKRSCGVKVHLDDSIYIQTGNPAPRAVDSGHRRKRREGDSGEGETMSDGGVSRSTTDLQCMMEEWCSPYSS